MVQEFSIISELKSLREQKSRISERESELSMPKLIDLELIPEIYKWFCELVGSYGPAERRASIRFRKQFIYIIMFLYSPSKLAGGKIAPGLRDILAGLLGFKSPTGISNLCVDVTFFYDNYRIFRKDIEYLYTEILNRLKIKGLIN